MSSVAAHSSSAEDEWKKWCAARYERLSAPFGWPSLIALVWLETAACVVVQTADGDVVALDETASSPAALPAGATPMVRLSVAADGATVTATPTALVTALDAEPIDGAAGAPFVLPLQKPLYARSLQILLQRRNNKLCLRVRDSQAAARLAFKGIDVYPYNEKLASVTGTFEPYAEPKKLRTPTMAGFDEEETVLGEIVVPASELFPTEVRLLPFIDGPNEWLIVFRDATSGKETYGGGRMVSVPAVKSGPVTIDFNRSFVSPCHLTDYATCAVPPNRLPVRIDAGEKQKIGAESSH